MPKSAANTRIELTVDIRPGPATPAARAAWAKFWGRLISELQQKEGGK